MPALVLFAEAFVFVLVFLVELPFFEVAFVRASLDEGLRPVVFLLVLFPPLGFVGFLVSGAAVRGTMGITLVT